LRLPVQQQDMRANEFVQPSGATSAFLAPFSYWCKTSSCNIFLQHLLAVPRKVQAHDA